MRTTFVALWTAALFTTLAFAQDMDKTFYFTQPTSTEGITAITTMIRTVVDLRQILPDPAHQALVAHGPVDKLVATEWLFHQLDRAGSRETTQYKMSGGGDNVVSVLRVSPSATAADITALTTAIRTVADIQRLFPLEGWKTLVARSTPEQIAAADWMVRQLSPPDGDAPSADSPPYPMAPFRPEAASEVIRIFRLAPDSTVADLTSRVTAIRTVADIQRLFPFASGKAMVLRASPEKAAVAEWFVHELAKPADPRAVHETRLGGVIDNVVRLFYVDRQTSPADLTALATQIRASGEIQRLFPLTNPPSVILRGRPDQMSIAEALVAKFASGAR